MNMTEIFQKLESTSSRLEKEKILRDNSNNTELTSVIKYALDPYKNYFIKKIPEFTAVEFPQFSLMECLNELDVLAQRIKTGHEAINHLSWILANSGTNYDVIIRIIERDLKCGVDVKTVNKIWPGLIPTFDVMLAHKDISGIKYPAIAQTKMDGARAHLVWDGKHATAWSRQGKQFHLGDVFDETIKSMFGDTTVTLDGELLFTDNDGNFLDRKTSNGRANKANKNTLSPGEASRAVYVTWDIADFTSTIPYDTRFNQLVQLWKTAYSSNSSINIKLVEYREVFSEQDAKNFYLEQIAAGEEGAVIKNIKAVWQPKRTKDLGKMKAEEEADLKIVRMIEGTGKYSGMLGSIEGTTKDGRLVVSIGTGLTDNQRKLFWENRDDYVNKIVSVKYNQIIKDKDLDTYSLFLPVFVEMRFDKTVANTLDELK